MLEWRTGGVRCRVSLLFPAMLTALLLTQPDGQAVTCVIASAMHECGHLLAMLLLNCRPECCTLGAFGMRIEAGRTHLSGYGRQIAVSLAGPAVNGLAGAALWLLGQRTAAAVHWLLGGFNLLPAAALDGGQILRCLLFAAGRETAADRVLAVLSAAVLLPVAAAAWYLLLAGRGNVTLLIVSLYLTLLVFFHPA